MMVGNPADSLALVMEVMLPLIMMMSAEYPFQKIRPPTLKAQSILGLSPGTGF